MGEKKRVRTRPERSTLDFSALEGVVVREARPEDLDLVARIEEIAHEESGVADELRDHLRRRVFEAEPGSVRIVAEAEGAVAGTIEFRAEAPGRPEGWAEIGTIAVRPDARGRGLGRRLIEECVERARQRGAATIVLRVPEAMSGGSELARSLGFRPDPGHDLRRDAMYAEEGVSVLDRRWDRPGAEVVARTYRLDLSG